MKSLIAYPLLAMSILGASTGNALAANEDLQNTTNAVSICHGARPSDEAKLSSTALKLRNDSTTNAFVTCAFVTMTDQAGAGGLGTHVVNYFGAFFTNENNVAATINCTGVQGSANDTRNVYETQTTMVPPNNAPATPTSGYIFFGPASSTDPLYYQDVSMTCLMPPGVSIADTYVGFKMDDATNAP